MNPFLRLLMGQQTTNMPGVISGYGGGTFNADGSEATPVDNQIIVEAQRNNTERGGSVDGMSAPNDRAIEAVQADVKRGQEASDRRGMFGVKGTLRDVLGLVGDAFLIQSGNAPMYAPRRRQEQISDAMAGFTEDPVSAAERTAYYDPATGRQLYSDYQDNLIKEAQAASLKASRENQIADRDGKRYQNVDTILGGLFNTPGAVRDGVISPEALARSSQIAKANGFTLDDFGIYENMPEEEVRGRAQASIDAYKQRRLAQYDTGLEQGQLNANSRAISARASMIRANRPPAGRAPRAESDREAAIRIGNKPASERTPGEQAFYDKYTSTGSSSGGKKKVPSLAPGWTIRPAGK